MINLCLDTNVYLSFYHFSDNDLQKLEEIITLIENQDLNIILPEQIKNEFVKNRESKILDALKTVKEVKIDFKLPRILDSYPEKNELKELFNSYCEKKNELILKAEEDVSTKSLKADVLIQKIFDKAENISMTDDVWEKAKRRFDLGKPPGKKKSYGDAIVWETLLNYDNGDTDIDFVSIDGDYKCPLNSNKLSNFLQIERDNIKNGHILFYSKLNSFFEKHFPGIRIDEEYLKNNYIDKFVNSRSFGSVKYNLSKIISFENYSLDQINKVIDGAVSNGQISRCIQYTPWVGEELVKLIRPYFDKIADFDKLMSFLEIYDPQAYNGFRADYEAMFAPKDNDESYSGEPF